MCEELIRKLRTTAKAADFFGAIMPAAENPITALYNEAADAIEELSKPRWIPVTERLPEQGKRYLVIRFDEVTKTQFIDILWHDAHDLWWNRLYKGQYNVTHWMPLPEPPKEEI